MRVLSGNLPALLLPHHEITLLIRADEYVPYPDKAKTPVIFRAVIVSEEVPLHGMNAKIRSCRGSSQCFIPKDEALLEPPHERIVFWWSRQRSRVPMTIHNPHEGSTTTGDILGI